MTSSCRRLPHPVLLGPSAALVLLAAVGCTSTDPSASVTVPTPSSEAAAYCRALHKELPRSVAGLERTDPAPRSDLTAGWGDGAIVLRCGVARPAKMDDSQSKAAEADGVNWLLEQREDDGPRFTTTLRKAYVEVTFSAAYAHDATPLAAFAAPVKKTVPSGL
ncbi:DUF3515 domain-containing protein [Streptomyces poriferorum]|uniref:DUF3515 domain-containing protein n=1 Tax=Streptomyces poriferorum TaxID=2798799 RepID=A0ABY9IR10_9ACTN|nr:MULTISPECIES: DUF3515 domain-containing protein [Streptomyces]WSQ43454.1 DUF3515 domain-containing protein [Streptomyces sp. NBC_01220]MBW5251864.1 DUF3515 domain-containing protein [Streptomyces poriferorum]MBW5259363.1 DUF3515 domain-containing protein [Streptomyces poriferorum]MDP5315019.1 DUF3515 domain-containing protein [Streptomyces sp. Alt4]WLQ51238.1 DUF3515 domain-containing protein [Streptomyces sp. Alt1]